MPPGTAPGGVLLAGLDNGFNFMVEDRRCARWSSHNQLPFNPLKMPPERLEQMVSTTAMASSSAIPWRNRSGDSFAPAWF
jgi:hypothetical protein